MGLAQSLLLSTQHTGFEHQDTFTTQHGWVQLGRSSRVSNDVTWHIHPPSIYIYA